MECCDTAWCMHGCHRRRGAPNLPLLLLCTVYPYRAMGGDQQTKMIHTLAVKRSQRLMKIATKTAAAAAAATDTHLSPTAHVYDVTQQQRNPPPRAITRTRKTHQTADRVRMYVWITQQTQPEGIYDTTNNGFLKSPTTPSYQTQGCAAEHNSPCAPSLRVPYLIKRKCFLNSRRQAGG